ncbi:hypothetical protein CTA1_8776 [Colletotrichum tanaceti]|uniref:Uncharacterized protein n=1 Tax=Colletotrichum tanaceti TaxID=1306861 RepID=A0A4U6XIN7_9PEZI|nr:hypothetical protein CTA1_8776 [Colletotrichum tanaceti]
MRETDAQYGLCVRIPRGRLHHLQILHGTLSASPYYSSDPGAGSIIQRRVDRGPRTASSKPRLSTMSTPRKSAIFIRTSRS